MKCTTCFRQCDLNEGQTGYCKARTNIGKTITDRNYGKITSAALDPIEKKPLAEFYPGSMILSVGSYGCNLSCPFCQNHSIAQEDLDNVSEFVSPSELISKALELIPYGNIGIAFTYNEPMISFEYVRDVSKLAHDNGLKTVVVTNGSVTKEALEEVLPYVDAFNIDLKAFSQDYYSWLGGNLETVKEFIKTAAAKSHVEITTLIVPGRNDSDEEMDQLASFIASADPKIPLHITRYFPRWKAKEEPTPAETLHRLKKTASKHLNSVYIGNL